MERIRAWLIVIFVIIGIILMAASDDLHSGNMKKDGVDGLKMFLTGLMFIGAAFLTLVLFRIKEK